MKSPLDDVEYVENVEKDTAAELTAVQRSFREHRKRQEDSFQAISDTGYYFSVCFQSREQRDAFLKQVGWMCEDKVVDGYEAAKSLGVKLPAPPAGLRFNKTKSDKTLAGLSLPFEE